ncbi:hypothetical protein BCV72DRAFT_254813 [Rhizopus microsporus var. microsporus]|uniref:Yeast cell wall synthesis Kre9/Knh1-like N-terminal domain-containing protein n=2 Tax=Rhizopus microsporus TaxID=58291 RepID=A0A2G4SLU5_RHIZD|nr:uncharacterized protein RHIMIDRAFT_294545 [Rhizopus microsporus ATCC 52813]ORE09521.1 hypothetical protein BCV72DRAFT_254813 [Rhizopus microsporus var. microsporus]PHZ09366.1 hypothetical protein RHIMIDRAFT_294545 [Rhizopus microsporus ATCC 52813]
MVSVKTFIATSAALIAAFVNVEAAVAPTYPSPGTIQVQGQSYDITWTFDGKNASETYQIDFMTGSNLEQKKLATVATGVPANLLKYPFVAPQVSPNSAVYFFMFTGSQGDQAWTTRFGIVAANGDKLTPEPQQTQPTGEKIPWGDGKLLTAISGNNSSASSAPAAAASSSAPVVAAAAASSAAPSSSAPIVVAAAATSSTPASVPSAVTSTAPSSVAQKSTSAGSMVKPALSLIAVGAAGYMLI